MTGRWREENWFRYGRAHFLGLEVGIAFSGELEDLG